MSLTSTQRAVLAAHIRSNPDPNVVAALATRNDTELTRLYNLEATPPFVAWRTFVNLDEITQNGFTWTEVDNLTVGKARIWEWLFKNSTNSINPSKDNVRAGIIECWSGTANRLAVQAVVLGHCKRNLTVAEKLFATGSGTTLFPGNIVFEGDITIEDVGRALNDN